ncbi:hypothetical protein [Alkalilacustris brevis]|uniref:hypothetical protein n=1 Tax=Alkalilacustris brevis TaxID=2026338 RepID=UPI000E0CD23D|nr:hypothetical protein [Alkalilacustris brevis]
MNDETRSPRTGRPPLRAHQFTARQAGIGAVGALLWLLLAATPALAGQISVRSGEHPGFTRLVMALPEGAAWRLTPVPRGYELVLTGAPGAVFDLGTVFNRIRRDRIAAITASATPPRLVLDVPCDCEAVTFTERPNYLVVDIRSPVAEQISAAAPPPNRPPRYPTPAERDQGAGPKTPPLRGYDWTARLLPPADEAPQGAAADGAPAPDSLSGAADRAREVLITQFARAASQGLLEIGPEPKESPEAADDRGTPVLRKPQELTAPDSETPPAPDLFLGAETAVDQATRQARQTAPPASAHLCPPPAQYDLAAWGSGATATELLAQARGRLLGEFDTAREEQVIAFARLNLFLGFGAEALAVLGAFPGDSPDRTALHRLAPLLDDERPPPAAPLAGLEGCPGPVALWALLSSSEGAVPQGMNREAILQSFAALPAHLRHHLAARLARHLIAAGERDAALSVRGMISRTPGGTPESAALIDAMLDLEDGNTGAALRNLAPVATGHSHEAPAALARMVEAMIAEGAPPDADMLENLAALTFEHQGTDLGAHLERLEILGLATAGRFAEAFAARHAQAAADRPVAAPDEAKLFALLTEQAANAAFLQHLVTESAWRNGRLPAATRHALARRALDLGFPELARQALPQAEDAGGDDRVLHAEAALNLGDAAEARDLLEGVSGDWAVRLRARALMRLDAPVAALAAYAAAGPAEELQAELRHAAWRSGDAAAIALHGDALQRASIDGRHSAPPPGEGDAGTASPDAPPPGPGAPEGLPSGPAPLARAEQLVEDSRSMRMLILDLLDAHAIPAAPTATRPASAANP